MKKVWFVMASFMAFMIICSGCGGGCSKFPTESDDPGGGTPGPPTVTSLGYIENGIEYPFLSLDEDTTQIIADFVYVPSESDTANYRWGNYNTNGYWVITVVEHSVCMATSGPYGKMFDSLFINVGSLNPANRHLLTALNTNLNGNFWKWRAFPDSTLQNGEAPNGLYEIAFHHLVADSSDMFEGNATNWKRSSSLNHWLVEGSSYHIFECLVDGEYVLDTLLYATSYNRVTGQLIHAYNVVSMLEHPPGSGSWHAAAYLGVDGMWSPVGEFTIRVWFSGP